MNKLLGSTEEFDCRNRDRVSNRGVSDCEGDGVMLLLEEGTSKSGTIVAMAAAAINAKIIAAKHLRRR